MANTCSAEMHIAKALVFAGFVVISHHNDLMPYGFGPKASSSSILEHGFGVDCPGEKMPKSAIILHGKNISQIRFTNLAPGHQHLL